MALAVRPVWIWEADMGSANLDSRGFLAAPFDFLSPAGRTAKEVADPLLHQRLGHRRGGPAAGQEPE